MVTAVNDINRKEMQEREEHRFAADFSPASGFFFTSPYRSLTTTGCFSRIRLPAADGADLNGEFQRRVRQAFAEARQAGIKKPLLCGLFALIALPLMAWTLLTQDRTNQIMMLLMLISAYFSVQDVYKIYYDALLKSKLNTLINNVALLLSIVMRLGLVYAQLPLVWFALPYVLSSLLPYAVRWVLFRREQAQMPAISGRHKRRYGRYLFSVGLPLAISSLSIVIYTRIDQIMLGNYLGEHSVGLYSAAITLSQGWVFVPIALIMSMMPGVANAGSEQEQEARIRQLYLMVLVLSMPVIAVLSLFPQQIVALMFGESYRQTATILALCSVTSLFSVMGTVSYRAIVLFSGYRFIAIKMPLAALANVVMNFILIPRYGIMGAAISTLITEFISFFVLNSFFRGGKITRLQVTCYRCFPQLIGKVREIYVK